MSTTYEKDRKNTTPFECRYRFLRSRRAQRNVQQKWSASERFVFWAVIIMLCFPIPFVTRKDTHPYSYEEQWENMKH